MTGNWFCTLCPQGWKRQGRKPLPGSIMTSLLTANHFIVTPFTGTSSILYVQLYRTLTIVHQAWPSCLGKDLCLQAKTRVLKMGWTAKAVTDLFYLKMERPCVSFFIPSTGWRTKSKHCVVPKAVSLGPRTAGSLTKKN